MRQMTLSALAALALTAAVAAPSAGAAADDGDSPTFSDPTRIDNPYLPMSKFHRCILRGQEEGVPRVIRRTVLDRTRTFIIEGVAVQAMVVKDRVHSAGELIEVTHDFFAQDAAGAVHYLGERVDNIRNGRVANHNGQWIFGKDTDKLGTLMPADPHVGSHWMSEDAPSIAVEHDRVVGRGSGVEVRGHTYRRTITVREFASLDKELEHKIYAKGVGVVDELPTNGDVGLAGCSKG